MWGVGAVEDRARPADPDAVLRSVSHTLRHDTAVLEDILARVRPGLGSSPEATRLLAPVDDYLLVGPGLADSWDPDVRDTGGRALPSLDTARLTALRLAGRRSRCARPGCCTSSSPPPGRTRAARCPSSTG